MFCTSLTATITRDDLENPEVKFSCEALAKASNFLWELELCAEFSDPERFGASNEYEVPKTTI